MYTTRHDIKISCMLPTQPTYFCISHDFPKNEFISLNRINILPFRCSLWRRRRALCVEQSHPSVRLWPSVSIYTVCRIFFKFGAGGLYRKLSRKCEFINNRHSDSNYTVYILFHNVEEETNKMLHLELDFVWCWNLDASVSRSEIPGKSRNVVLEEDGEDQLDRSCEKWRSVT